MTRDEELDGSMGGPDIGWPKEYVRRLIALGEQDKRPSAPRPCGHVGPINADGRCRACEGDRMDAENRAARHARWE